MLGYKGLTLLVYDHKIFLSSCIQVCALAGTKDEILFHQCPKLYYYYYFIRQMLILFVWQTTEAALEEDVSLKMKRRAFAGYGIDFYQVRDDVCI